MSFLMKHMTVCLKKIKSNYPNAEIWCCTLCETYMSKQPDFKFPHKYAGTHIEEYNEIIRTVAKHNGCRLIDMYQYKTPYDSVDGTHPTASEMSTIATMMIRSMSLPKKKGIIAKLFGKKSNEI